MRRVAWPLVVSLTILPVAAPAARTAVSQPNIILVVVDDQTIGTLKAMPNVRALIRRQGTRYTSAFVSNPLCCPSRASILTGLYSHGTRTYTNEHRGDSGDPWVRFGGAYAFHETGGNDDRTIASDLQEVGYHTGLIGKYLNGYRSYADDFHGDGTPGSGAGWVPAGWDEWVALYEDNGRYFDYDLDVNGRVRHLGSDVREHSTRVLGNRAVRFLEGRPADRPFFLYFAPNAPHAPFTPEARDEDLFRNTRAFDSPAVGEDVSDKPTYIQAHDADRQSAKHRMRALQTLYGVDRQVGRILAALTPDELANTIVVYTSDNGKGDGEHGWTYKIVPYERSIRVPLFIRWPGHTAAGGSDRSFVLNVDLAPTLLAAAGHAAVRSDGVDIFGADDRTSFLLEAMYYPRGPKGSVPTYCGIVTRDWKYVVYSPTEREPDLVTPPFEEELYDRAEDPWELENVAPTRPDVVAQMREALSALCDPPPPDTTDAWWRAWAMP